MFGGVRKASPFHVQKDLDLPRKEVSPPFLAMPVVVQLHHLVGPPNLVADMKVTVATLSDTVFTLEVSPDMEVENFKVNS